MTDVIVAMENLNTRIEECIPKEYHLKDIIFRKLIVEKLFLKIKKKKVDFCFSYICNSFSFSKSKIVFVSPCITRIN